MKHTASAATVTSGAVVSWALYDLANTVFSMNIVSLYFPDWVVNVMGGTDALYGYATSASMFVVFLVAPTLGALSDQAGSRMPFLVVSTVACVALTMLLGIGGLAMSLIVFALANIMFQCGLIFYDSLLAVVSHEGNRGRVSGLGIGVGYLGSFLGVGSGLLLLDRIGHVGMFRLTGILFLAFAIPCFLFVKEPPRGRAALSWRRAVGGAFAQLKRTVPQVRRHKSMGRFLVGRFFYTDPANTVIVFMTIYATREVGYSLEQAQVVMLAAISAAVVGGIGWGQLVDRRGPRRTLELVLVMWLVALAGIILAARPGSPPALLWVAGALAGAALGGLWASDRPLLLRLAPPDQVGEFYGIYAMVGRFAAIVGPLLWAVIVDGLGWGRPAAVASLMALMVVALVLIHGVDDSPRTWPRGLDNGAPPAITGT